MEYRRVKILLVEDDPDDVWILRSLLGDRWDGPLELIHVELLSSALEPAAAAASTCCCWTSRLPDSQGLETFLKLSAHGGRDPHRGDHRTGRRADRDQGGPGRAQDYLIKGQVNDNLLVRSIRYAIERSRRDHAERELRATSEEFRIAQEIQRRLYPGGGPAPAGLRHRRGGLPGHRHGRRLLRLHPPAGTTAWGSSSAT